MKNLTLILSLGLLMALPFSTMSSPVDSRTALAVFLSNNASTAVTLTERSQILSITLKNGYYDDLTYRIRSTDCIIDVTFVNDQWTTKNITCQGKKPEASFMQALETAMKDETFKKVQQTAYIEDELEKEVVLNRSIRELEKRYKLGEINQENAKKLFDDTMTIFFCSGHGVSGGFVTNGEIKEPLMLEILESLSYRTVSRVYNLRTKLGFN